MSCRWLGAAGALCPIANALLKHLRPSLTRRGLQGGRQSLHQASTSATGGCPSELVLHLLSKHVAHLEGLGPGLEHGVDSAAGEGRQRRLRSLPTFVDRPLVDVARLLREGRDGEWREIGQPPNDRCCLR